MSEQLIHSLYVSGLALRKSELPAVTQEVLAGSVDMPNAGIGPSDFMESRRRMQGFLSNASTSNPRLLGLRYKR